MPEVWWNWGFAFGLDDVECLVLLKIWLLIYPAKKWNRTHKRGLLTSKQALGILKIEASEESQIYSKEKENEKKQKPICFLITPYLPTLHSLSFNFSALFILWALLGVVVWCRLASFSFCLVGYYPYIFVLESNIFLWRICFELQDSKIPRFPSFEITNDGSFKYEPNGG